MFHVQTKNKQTKKEMKKFKKKRNEIVYKYVRMRVCTYCTKEICIFIFFIIFIIYRKEISKLNKVNE